jgi:Protein of unknown function (DUF3800)
MIHGDKQWREVERAIDNLIATYIPEDDRLDFVFHATDIYHGSRYFDRAKWDRPTREDILKGLAKIIADYHLPIVVGGYKKDRFAAGQNLFEEHETNLKHSVMQLTSAMDCALWADRWLARYAPQENAMIVAEDADRVKPMIKRAIRTLRSENALEREGISECDRLELGMPLKRIVDTVHFAAKADSKPLQLADLCAFSINRVMKGKPMDEVILDIIFRHWWWSTKVAEIAS